MTVNETPTTAATAVGEITDEYMQEKLAGARTYTAMVIHTTEKAAEPGAEELIWEHGRRNMALTALGTLPIVCPGADETDFAGIAVFDGTPEEIDALLREDPGVKAGIFRYELHPVLGFPGATLPE